MQCIAKIIDGPLPTLDLNDLHQDSGAELVFHGRVRADEHGQRIAALYYEQYEGMAQRELQVLVAHTVEKFALSSLQVWHRVGLVTVGHASLRVIVLSRHRAESLAAMEYFISTLKQSVPIWKWAVLEDGTRTPTFCSH